MALPVDETGDFDDIVFLEVHAGDGDGASLIFDFNGQRIDVSIFPTSPRHSGTQDSIPNRLIGLLGRAFTGDNDLDESEELVDQVPEVILEPGRPIFKALATSPTESSSSRDLHSLMYPPMRYFQLVEVCGKAVINSIASTATYRVPADEAAIDSAEEDDMDIDNTLPCYPTRGILISEVFLKGSRYVACRVLVDGKELFCKAGPRTLAGTTMGWELQCLGEIRKHVRPENDTKATTIRVPQLLGYVRHPDTDRVLGFLREWIPGHRLRNNGIIAATSIERRQKWYEQIIETIHALHARGAVWDDGKANNVIIDEQDDAWLIGFGGDWAEGWVDEDLANTVQGDEQAISRIGSFLGIE